MVETAERQGRLAQAAVIVEPPPATRAWAWRSSHRSAATAACSLPGQGAADKIAVLRAYGAEVVVCPTSVPPDHQPYYSVARRLASETERS